jgi:hypothetical protein
MRRTRGQPRQAVWSCRRTLHRQRRRPIESWSRIRIASASSCAGTSPASTQPGAAPTVCCIESTSSSAKSWSSAPNTEEMFTDPDERSCRPPRSKTITGTAVRALEWSITTGIPGVDGVSDGLTCVPRRRRDRQLIGKLPQPTGTTNPVGCLWAFPAEMQRCPKTGVNGVPRHHSVGVTGFEPATSSSRSTVRESSRSRTERGLGTWTCA